MNRFRFFRNLILLVGLLLSHTMCAHVSYAYCAMEWGGRYAGYSAPPSVAFFLCIPYVAAILVCLLLAWRAHRKAGG